MKINNNIFIILVTVLALLVAMMGFLIRDVLAGDLLNRYLPSPIKADLQFRSRLEYRNNFDFNKSRDDKDAFMLYRTRLNLKYTPLKEFHIFTQVQDARISQSQFIDKSSFENYMDIRQLYGHFEDDWGVDALGMNKFSLRLGRQEFSYGAERLIGGFNWSKVAQTFDGGKVGFHFRPHHLQLDIFGGYKTLIKSPREMDDFFDATSRDRMWAYYSTAKPNQDLIVEQYLINRKTKRNISFGPNGANSLDEWTLGGRLVKAAMTGRWDYELELAGQWGDFGSKDIEAMMGVGIVGYTFHIPWTPRVAFEFAYGSGDSEPTDGTRKTFDNLYPTNHNFYGFMDLFSIQNLHDYRYLVSVKPNNKLKLQTDFHFFYLDTPKDSFYSAGRTVTRTASSLLTDVSSHVGNEIDVTLDYKATSWLNVLLGYSRFFSGKYLRTTGADDDTDFVYLQTLFNF